MANIVGLYCRTSTDRQANGLEAQELALTNYCITKIIKNYKIYKDFGISGAKESRPALNQLMADARDQKLDSIIVYSFSRFARSTSHLLSALEEFQNNNISFVSISENLDTATPMGKAVFTIISALSQLERELISERVKIGIANARAKGKQIGRKKTRPSELIKELRNKGYSYRQIAKLANCSHSSITAELRSM